MLGEVNFHTKPRWCVGAEYSVLAVSLVIAIAIAIAPSV
jgi:hypothetical protein